MIRFGIIGCGAISNTHASAIAQLDGAMFGACCDINVTRGQAFAQKNNCRFYDDYHALLADETLDAVIIATPHYLHATMSLASLAAGKHVLCEKPMATTKEDAAALAIAVEKSKKVYAVCFQNRFNPPFIKLKKMIEQNKFGNLNGVKCELTWHRDQAYYAAADWKGSLVQEGGGVLINQGIHTLDAITWFIAPLDKIKGKIMTSLLEDVIEVEDAAMATGLIGEIPIVIHASNNFSSSPSPTITFDFEKSSIVLSMETLMIDGQVVDIQSITQSAEHKAQWGDSHKRLIEAFCHRLNGQYALNDEYLPGLDARYALAIIWGIYDSNQLNRWVTL